MARLSARAWGAYFLVLTVMATLVAWTWVDGFEVGAHSRRLSENMADRGDGCPDSWECILEMFEIIVILLVTCFWACLVGPYSGCSLWGWCKSVALLVLGLIFANFYAATAASSFLSSQLMLMALIASSAVFHHHILTMENPDWLARFVWGLGIVHMLAFVVSLYLTGRVLFVYVTGGSGFHGVYETGLSVGAVAPVSLFCLLVPVIYLLLTQQPFMLVVEVFVSAADFGSDLLNSLTNDFDCPEMFWLSLCTTIGAGTVIIIQHYGLDIVANMDTTFKFVALYAWQFLADNGVHQVFEVAGHSFEKHVVNYLVTLVIAAFVPVFGLVFAPLATILRATGEYSLGMLLQSTRLLLLKPTQQWYHSIVGHPDIPSRTASETTSANDTSPIDKAKYHRMIFAEVFAEGFPSVAVTVFNYMLLRNKGAIDRMSWVATLSLFFSAYMVLRIGFKYSWYLCQGMTWSDIPLPFDEEKLSYKELEAKEMALKTGEAGFAAGSTAAQAAGALLKAA